MGIYELESNTDTLYNIIHESPFGPMDGFERILRSQVELVLSGKMDVYQNDNAQVFEYPLIKPCAVSKKDINRCFSKVLAQNAEKDLHPDVLPRYINLFQPFAYYKKIK